jgi:Tol biopolymer transport system component
MKRFAIPMVVTSLVGLSVLAVLETPARADFFFGAATNLGAPVNQGPCYSSSGVGEVDPAISRDELTLCFASSCPGGLGDGDLWLMTRATKQDPWGKPVNLGAHVNSAAGDWAPKFSADELSLYFHSNRTGGLGGTDIWMTRRAALDAPWESAINLGASINSSANEQDPTISPDGLTLYFDRAQATLFEAKRSSPTTSWASASVAVSSLNKGGANCHPFISWDGLSIYFCSNRAGGYGAMDIYVATRPLLTSPWGEPVNLGDIINTPYGQYAPCISADGLTLYYDESNTIRVVTRADLSSPWVEPLGLTSNDAWAQVCADGLTMYFASDRPGGCGYQDIWMAARRSPQDPWQEPVNLGPAVNSDDWDWAPCISADGLELYFTSEHDCIANDWDLWVSTRPTKDAPWGPAVNLGAGVNSPSPDGNCTLSADGLTLIFSSERTGGKGSGDLWMTRRAAVTEPWTAPVNLGEPVNTVRYEAGPSLSPDGRYLFYTSVQANNAATYNHIMLSMLGADGRWGVPRNLAQEVALPSNAGSPTISPDGYALYFTSDVPEGLGGSDIWSLEVNPIVDFTGDGQVDDSDVVTMEKYLGADEPACDIAPSLWGDGIVDDLDLAKLREYIGREFTDPTLIAHWALDESEGVVAHDDAGGREAVVYGYTIWCPSDGVMGGALEFAGVPAFVSAKDVRDPSAGSLSVLAWVKGGKPGQVVVSQQGGANWLMADADGTLATELQSGGRMANALHSSAVVTDGDWHRIALTWDGVNRRLYVDDVEVAADTQTSLAGSTGNLLLGASAKVALTDFWSGLIDEVRVYSRAVKP